MAKGWEIWILDKNLAVNVFEFYPKYLAVNVILNPKLKLIQNPNIKLKPKPFEVSQIDFFFLLIFCWAWK